jgi:hypothetical protein
MSRWEASVGARRSIDHPRDGHDDLANAAAGALVCAFKEGPGLDDQLVRGAQHVGLAALMQGWECRMEVTDPIDGLRRHLDMIPLWRDPSFNWSIRTGYVLSGRLERYVPRARDAEPIASVEELCEMTAQEIRAHKVPEIS